MKIGNNILSLLLLPSYSLGTYTTISYDTETGNIGGSGASCVKSDGINVGITYTSVPHKGVVTAQAYINTTARDVAIQKVYNGESAHSIMDGLSENPDFDREQYGIITYHDEETHTGSLNEAWAGHVTGHCDGYKYSFQGNALTSEHVGYQATTAFKDTQGEVDCHYKYIQRGCDMAWRLFRAVQGGGMNGQGDNRCTGRAGTTAYVRVDLNNGHDTGVFYNGAPGETTCYSEAEGVSDPQFCDFAQRGYPNAYLSIEIPADGGSDPLAKLDTEFRAWAAANNCHEEEPTPPCPHPSPSYSNKSSKSKKSSKSGKAKKSGKGGKGGKGGSSSKCHSTSTDIGHDETHYNNDHNSHEHHASDGTHTAARISSNGTRRKRRRRGNGKRN